MVNRWSLCWKRIRVDWKILNLNYDCSESCELNDCKWKEVKMGKIIAKNVVKRQSGFLYYVDGLGNVCEAKKCRGGRKKKTKKK